MHPHCLAILKKRINQFFGINCMEMAYYPPSYLASMLLVAKWYSMLILRADSTITDNNNLVLYMYGREGCGKSTIADMLEMAFTRYKWECSGIFQNIDEMTKASFIHYEESDINKLKEGKMKQLTDYTSSVKIQAKFETPMDLSERCPVVLGSNHDLL